MDTVHLGPAWKSKDVSASSWYSKINRTTVQIGQLWYTRWNWNIGMSFIFSHLTVHEALKAHLHGSNLRTLECHYLEKHGPKIQDYAISCNSNITSFIFYSTEYYWLLLITFQMHAVWLHYVVIVQHPCRCAFNFLMYTNWHANVPLQQLYQDYSCPSMGDQRKWFDLDKQEAISSFLDKPYEDQSTMDTYV